MILALISLVYSAHAVDFEHAFKGRFKRRHLPNDAVVIHPDHVKFRFCPKASIFHQFYIGEQDFDPIGLHQAQKEYILETNGDETKPQCLKKGKHLCTFTVGQWDTMKDRIHLIVSCDDSEFARIYDRRIEFGKKKKRRVSKTQKRALKADQTKKLSEG